MCIRDRTKGKQYLFAVTNHNLIKDLAFDSYLSYAPDKAIYFDSRKAGLMDRDGNIMLEPEYDEVMVYNDDLVRVKKNGHWGLVDKDGANVIPVIYNYISPMRGNVAVVRKGRLTGLISSSGELLTEPVYTKMEISENAIKAFKGPASVSYTHLTLPTTPYV